MNQPTPAAAATIQPYDRVWLDPDSLFPSLVIYASCPDTHALIMTVNPDDVPPPDPNDPHAPLSREQSAAVVDAATAWLFPADTTFPTVRRDAT